MESRLKQNLRALISNAEQAILSKNLKNGKETINSSSIQFVTVGEGGVVRIWNSDGQQKSSDLAVSSKKEEVKRGFTSAMMLPLGQGLLCATLDQQFLIYGVDKHADGGLNLFMRKRLIGYNKEIVDMKFLGEEEQFLAVATSVEQRSHLMLDMLSVFALNAQRILESLSPAALNVVLSAINAVFEL
ncbi:hypothetical protein OROHE_004600 [Orobanche hederae]